MKKHVFFLCVVLLLLVACGEVETAVMKSTTTALAVKQVMIEPLAMTNLVEVLVDTAVDERVVVETAVPSITTKQVTKMERFTLMFAPADGGETAVLEPTSQSASLLVMLMAQAVPTVGNEVVEKTADQSVPNAMNNNQQVNQSHPQSIPSHQINDSEDEYGEDQGEGQHNNQEEDKEHDEDHDVHDEDD